LQQLGGRLAAAPPKSEAGRRVIALDNTTMAVLREHKARQLPDSGAGGKMVRDRVPVHHPGWRCQQNGNDSSLAPARRCGEAIRIRYGLWRVVTPDLFELRAFMRATHAREANFCPRSAWRLAR
jgi:hypothetical protein